MRQVVSLLNEYGESHRDVTNKTIHWICVPLIFWSITALLWTVNLGVVAGFSINLAMVILFLVWLYYIRLSPKLSIGMLFFALLCLGVNYLLENNYGSQNLVYGALTVFVLAWIGQFYGHSVEGKKPSFFKDLQFLLVGPAWLMHFIYNKLGIKW